MQNANISTKYLGQKGYTILKSELTPEQEEQIKKKLCVKPFMPGAPVNNSNTFNVFRESSAKLYVPRYFGIKEFGAFNTNKLPDGDNIAPNVTFNGRLREAQIPAANSYLKYVNNGGSALLELPCAFGKTALSLFILSKIGKKSLIIVHKEFLLNQWVKRIQDFLPNARIGRLQGNIVDIENKDIVIAMLQSLTGQREYPASTFTSFGMTIVDEVHHISSECFSQSLFKVVTKYMLGLSATLNRKDGTTGVIKMFLGDVVYSKKRDGSDDSVLVRGIRYKHNNEEFNQNLVDFRGNPQYSTMITNLCNFNPRTEFIIRILKDMIECEPDEQIMILAQNKSILKYIFTALGHRDIATCGYYIGGMKERDLEESESKQIILATYSMAAEGLDIKTLSRLLMITPRSDIEQAVGRILREKHANPMVVDFIDTHDVFQNQWKKRRRFYKSQKYKIDEIDSNEYCGANTQWKTTFNGKEVTQCYDDKPSKIPKCRC
jgi:superfamily II DNA or RNA helicase